MNQSMTILFICCTALVTTQVTPYHVFMFANQCPFPIWLALSGNSGSEHFDLKDVKLEPNHGTGMPFPNAWTGRIWAKTNCNETGHCQTGDCGLQNNCQKSGPTTAATVAYFALDSLHQQDYYQISLVNGFNVPIEVEPLNHPNHTYDAIGGHCASTGCKHDLNEHCSEHLAVKDSQNHTVACHSPCQAFGSEQYCCTGAYRTESACKSSTWPTDYVKIFHESCPGSRAYTRDTTSQPNFCESHSVRFNVNFCIKH